MALSDACFEFLEAVSTAARELSQSVHWYSAPGYPLKYGDEIDALRRACAAVAERPYDAEAIARMTRLATTVMRYLDAPPDSPQLAEHRREMKSLIQLLQVELEPDEAEAVPALVENIVQETRFTEAAAEHFKSLLPRLGKVAYETTIKILTDVASATAKKVLGL